MKNFALSFVICISLFFATLVDGQDKLSTIMQPFHWKYDVVYTKGKQKYKGEGAYILEDKNEEGTYRFMATLQTNNRVLKSRDILTLRYDAQHIVIPLSRKQRNVVFGFPRNKKIKLDESYSPYYDALSALLLLKHDLTQWESQEEFQRELENGKLDASADRDFAVASDEGLNKILNNNANNNANSPKIRWKLWMADAQKWEEFYLGDDETINTPLGDIECYVVHKVEDRPDRIFKVWMAKEGKYIARMLQHNRKEVTVMNIKQID